MFVGLSRQATKLHEVACGGETFRASGVHGLPSAPVLAMESARSRVVAACESTCLLGGLVIRAGPDSRRSLVPSHGEAPMRSGPRGPRLPAAQPGRYTGTSPAGCAAFLGSTMERSMGYKLDRELCRHSLRGPTVHTGAYCAREVEHSSTPSRPSCGTQTSAR